jgi:enamine deaminase RidA (YjgF/YER057c/UK114 family)
MSHASDATNARGCRSVQAASRRTAAADGKRRIKKTPIACKQVLNEAYDYEKKVSFVRGMRVELDNCVMLFISGTASVDDRGRSIHPGDLKAQTRRTFNNIKGLLESEGADWHDIVRTTCYLADFRHYDEFNEARNRFYEEERLDPLPASTCIEARICRPELLVEIEAIAMIPKDRTPPAKTK